MTNSALDLTQQGPTYDGGHRVRRGFTNLVWERVFGTAAVATIPTGIAVTSVNQMWDQTAGTGAGFWPYLPEGFPVWRCERLPGNAEMQRYRHFGTVLRDGPTGTGNILAQATYGDPHTMGTDYIACHARLHPSIIDDAGVTSLFTLNTDTSVQHNLNAGFTITCEIPAGLSGFAPGQRLIIGSSNPNSGLGKERGCSATVVSYIGTTLTATSNGAPNNMVTASVAELYIIQMNIEAGMFVTRTNLPPQLEGYYESELQYAPGAGHWIADWLSHEGCWPPELDRAEWFETLNAIRRRVHAGFISSATNRKITQLTKTYGNWCTADSSNELRNMEWGSIPDLSVVYTKNGLEIGHNFVTYALDDAMMRSEFYRWIAIGNSSSLPVGQVSFNPRWKINYAIGPPVENYRPDSFALFPGDFRIKSLRFYTRP